MNKVECGRIYDPSPTPDYVRILVDRLWPRGIRKDQTWWSLWLPEVAPSPTLRSWYHAHRDAYPEFRKQYLKEIAVGPQKLAWDELYRLANVGPVMILTYSRIWEHSHLPIL
ncbi:MAG: hypothetical protein C7B46_12190, partial [Sulfobacillus benefaciens]